METAPKKPPEDPLRSARKERARIWWHVYIIGCCLYPLGMILYPLASTPYLNIGACGSAIFIPLVILLLPVGLSYTMGSLIAACLHHEWHPMINEVEPWAFLTIPFAYAIFALHFYLTKRANTRRVFLLLMISLILLIGGSLVSCVRESSRPIGMQN